MSNRSKSKSQRRHSSPDHSYVVAPNPSRSRYVSIDLKDLGSSASSQNFSKEKNKSSIIEPARPIIVPSIAGNTNAIRPCELLGDETTYKNELMKLFQKSKGTPYEQSLRDFLESKFDKQRRLSTDNRSHTEESDVADTETKEHSKYKKQILKIEELSKPSIREEIKILPRKFNYASTNSMGRQRPPPTETFPNPPIGSGPPVSVRDFNAWLRRTSSWHDSVKEAVHNTQTENNLQMSKLFQPRLNSKTEKYARTAHSKERYEQHKNELDNSSKIIGKSEGEHETEISESADGVKDLTQPNQSIISDDNRHQTMIENSQCSNVDVYDRLSARGREYAQKRLNWVAPVPQYSFSPEITKKSKEILKKKRYRSSSVSASPSAGLSDDRKKGHFTSLELQGSILDESVEGSKLKGDANSTSLLASGEKSGLKRSKSVDGKGKIVGKKLYYEDELTFHPKLDRESLRLISRKNETFQDRLNRSVENFHIVNTVARRSISPGPGYYNNISRPASASKASRSQSPGSAGYTFGKFSKDLDISFRY